MPFSRGKKIGGPMSKIHRRVLQKCRVKIVEDLDVSLIKDIMVQRDVFDPNMMSSVLSCSTKKEQASKFMDDLPTRGEKAFHVFVKELGDKYEHLQQEIMRAREREEREATLANDSNPAFVSGNMIRKVIEAKNSQTENRDLSSTFDDFDEYEDEWVDTEREDSIEGYIEPYSSNDIQGIYQRLLPEVPNSDATNEEKIYDVAGQIDEQAVYQLREGIFCRKMSVKEQREYQSSCEDCYVQCDTPPDLDSLNGFSSSEALDDGDNIFQEKEELTESDTLVKHHPETTAEKEDVSDEPSHEPGIETITYHDCCNEKSLSPEDKSIIQLEKGDMLIPAPNLKSNKDGDENKVLLIDTISRGILVSMSALKKFGDPDAEPWFYPVPITTEQAEIMLSEVKQEGVFLVYRAHQLLNTKGYMLSLGKRDGTVLTYRIQKKAEFILKLEKHDKLFTSITKMIHYYMMNKTMLVCRLRRPLKYAKCPITPGIQFPEEFSIKREEMKLNTKTVLGKGNFAEVIYGIYKNQGVAVKVLQRKDAKAEEMDDFMDEAKLLMNLRHENIIKVIGICCDGYPLCIILELMEEGNLADWLRKLKGKNDEEIEDDEDEKKDGRIDALTNCCHQVIDALLFLESKRYVIHRDIAARNCLVQDAAGADIMCNIKLADFGMARQVLEDEYQASRKERIAVRWSAPEVLEKSSYSTKSDVWAAGILFWEIFSLGLKPYPDKDSNEVILFVTEKGRLEKPVLCPKEMYSVMRAAWKEDPKDRPSCSSIYEKLAATPQKYYMDTNAVHAKAVIAKLPFNHNTTAELIRSKSEADITKESQDNYNIYMDTVSTCMSTDSNSSKSSKRRPNRFLSIFTKTKSVYKKSFLTKNIPDTSF